MSTTVNHWINGAEFVSKSGRTFPVYDPALGTETKRVALADQAEINAAIKAAKDAFPKWRDESLAKRQQIIFKFRELLNDKKSELAEIITSEHGKVLSDALGVKLPVAKKSLNLQQVSPTYLKASTLKMSQPA